MTDRTKSRSAIVLVGTLLLGTALGAGSVAWSSANHSAPVAPTPVAASAQPLTLGPVMNQAGFADLVEKVQPAVVQIATTEPSPQMSEVPGMPDFPPNSPFGEMFRQFFGEQNGQMFQQQNRAPAHALGSGFIIDQDGYIVTNNHVIDGAHEIKITLTDGSSYKAKIIGRDKKTDLGLLKIEANKPLPYVPFGDSSKERVGDWVIAVGNPYGLGGTVTAGIVSAMGRNINEGPYDDFMQIDAPINPGNSGGPLFDQSGHVVGIDTAIYTPSGGSVGIGFAIPSNLAKDVVAQLKAHGKVTRGWIGLVMQPLTPALATAVGLKNTDGVLVNQVQKDSPAERAGIKQGDVITAFNGEAIKKPRDLAVDVARVAQGKTVGIKIWRGEHEKSLRITIGAKKDEKTASNDNGDNAGPVGLSLAPLTDDARSQMGLDSSTQGVVVANVRPDSRAAESGIVPGDVIIRVGRDKVRTPSEAANEIRSAERDKKDAIPLLVWRNGTTYYVGLQLAAG